LYDLQTDPDEITNLAYEPAHRDRLKSLQNKLKAWQQETRDPWFLKWNYE
jgi:N-sulfoglucosamine sulfohydrolase